MDYVNLKGNLGLKSSPLAPTACKLSKQLIVLDHMSHHYTKIARAKSAIDSRPPKSLIASQKMRDRVSRDRLTKSPHGRSNSSLSGVNVQEYEDILRDEPEDDEEKLVHSIMKSTLLDKTRTSNRATYGSASSQPGGTYETHIHMSQHVQPMTDDVRHTIPYSTMTYNQPESVRSVRSGNSLHSSPPQIYRTNAMSAVKIIKGDILEKRPYLFTDPERPFTPRTLKKNINVESRLKHSKCYNPPRSKRSPKREDTLDKDTTKILEPQISQNKKLQKERNYSNNDLENTAGTSQLSESMLMDITLRSRNEGYGQNTNHNVPPLAITVDKDHMNWLQEQASKAEVRVRSSGRLKSSLHPDKELHLRNRHSGLGESIKMEKQKKDEEQKYLAFAKEVTDDILSRGISSDSVLCRVFENHIERRKHDLNEDRMRKVISDLRKNLGLKDSAAEGIKLASLSGSNYSNRFRKQSDAENRSSYDHQPSSKSAAVKEDNDSPHQQEMNSSTASLSTLKFGQTRDVLSTINSETCRETEETEQDGENGELTATLKQYQLSLTAQEEVAEENNSTKESQPFETSPTRSSRRSSTKSIDSQPVKMSPARASRRNSNRSTASQPVHMSTTSSRRSSIEPQQKRKDPEVSSGATSQNSGNHKLKDEEDVSNRNLTNIEATLPPEGNANSQNIPNDSDVSVQRTAPSHRPVVRPRTRVRQDLNETTQEKADVVTPAAETEKPSENESHSSNIAEHGHRNSVADVKVAGASLMNDNTTADLPDAYKKEIDNPHQATKEEEDEYEEDYEEVIESGEDGQEDSGDDF